MTCFTFTEGENLTMQALSPSIIILRPPDELVLEIQTSGRFFALEWRKDGASSGFDANSFAHFSEVHYVENTSAVHLGRYEARLIPFNGSAQVSPLPIVIEVILHGMDINGSCCSKSSSVLYVIQWMLIPVQLGNLL